MKNPTTICATCKGTGTVPLRAQLSETLARFKGGARLTAADIYDPEKQVSVNAINNRLEKLRELGYLTRKRDGLSYRYTKTRPKKEEPKKTAD